MGNSGCICGKESTKDKVSDVEVPSKEKSKSTMNLPLYSRATDIEAFSRYLRNKRAVTCETSVNHKINNNINRKSKASSSMLLFLFTEISKKFIS